MHKLTLEERIDRLERLVNKRYTNEFLGFGKKKYSSEDGESFARMFSFDSKLKNLVSAKQATSHHSNEFYVIVSFKDKKKYDGWFLISGGNTKNMYCGYYKNSDAVEPNKPIDSLKNVKPFDEFDDIKEFIIDMSETIARKQ